MIWNLEGSYRETSARHPPIRLSLASSNRRRPFALLFQIPAMLAGVVGLSVANIFLSFYEAAAETVLLCFGEDRRLHRGVAEFAPRKLLAVLGEEVRMPPTCFFVCLCSIWGRRSISPPFFAQRKGQVCMGMKSFYITSGGNPLSGPIVDPMCLVRVSHFTPLPGAPRSDDGRMHRLAAAARARLQLHVAAAGLGTVRRHRGEGRLHPAAGGDGRRAAADGAPSPLAPPAADARYAQC